MKMKTFKSPDIQLIIHSPAVQISDELNQYILGQIEKLGKTFSRIERCDMMLKTKKNNKRQNCEMEGRLLVPGQMLFASSRSEHFRIAAKMIFENLHNQLTRFKAKITDKKISN
jgi:ribosomal subunit interface protein